MKWHSFICPITLCFVLCVLTSCGDCEREDAVYMRRKMAVFEGAPSLENYEGCRDEIIYLAAKSDLNATLLGLHALVIVLSSDVVVNSKDYLGEVVYNSDAFGRAFRELTEKKQRVILDYYDAYQPLDWTAVRSGLLR